MEQQPRQRQVKTRTQTQWPNRTQLEGEISDAQRQLQEKESDAWMQQQ